MSKVVFGVKYMSVVWGSIQYVSLRTQPLYYHFSAPGVAAFSDALVLHHN